MEKRKYTRYTDVYEKLERFCIDRYNDGNLFLPSERNLARMFGASLMTVRKAVEEALNNGIITRSGRHTNIQQNRCFSKLGRILFISGNSEQILLLLDRLGSSDLIPGSCNTMIYLIRGLAKQKERGEKLIWQYLNGYEKMLFSGATSLWETPFGTDDFRAAGSLCHAWSSIHVYWAGAGVLGVEPLEPGFKRFRVSPRTGELDRAQGVVPTPAGDISVKWQKVHCKLMLEITHPQALKPEFQGDFSAVICNGRKIL